MEARIKDVRGVAQAQTVLVRVETDTGVVGWGEAYGGDGIAPATAVALETMVAPRCAGLEPSADLPAQLGWVLYALSAAGPLAYALSGLDLALWDVLGKLQGRPVRALLAGTGAADLAACREPLDEASTHDTTALHALRRRSGGNVAWGTQAASLTEFERVLGTGAIALACVNVTRQGGVGGLRRLAARAAQCGVALAPRVAAEGPGLYATLHACAALAPEAVIRWAGAPAGSRLAVPAGPGLGWEPSA